MRNIAEVTTAVANGDLSKKITVDVQGRDPRAEEHHQHDGRPARLVRLGSDARGAAKSAPKASSAARPRCKGVAGTWKDLTDNVNAMAGNLTGAGARRRRRSRPRSPAATSSKKITVDARGEILADQEHHQHDGRPARLVRLGSDARGAARSAPKASWAARPRCSGVAGTWKDLTDNVNSMAGNLTSQVRNIAEVTTAVANGDLSKKITVDVQAARSSS